MKKLKEYDENSFCEEITKKKIKKVPGKFVSRIMQREQENQQFVPRWK